MQLGLLVPINYPLFFSTGKVDFHCCVILLAFTCMMGGWLALRPVNKVEPVLFFLNKICKPSMTHRFLYMHKLLV